MNNAKNIGVAMVIDMAAMDMDSDIDTKIDNCKGLFAETKSVARVRILKKISVLPLKLTIENLFLSVDAMYKLKVTNIP